MNLGYAILALLAVAVLLQLMLWRAQRTVFRQLRDHNERLALLEKPLSPGEIAVRRVTSEIAAPPAARPAAAPDPLQQAISLARVGRTAQEISASCGISEAEAELLVRMRGAPM